MKFNFSNIFGTTAKATVADGKPVEVQSAERAARGKTKGEDKVIAYFQSLGFEDVQPRVNVKTFEQWKKEGRIVSKGQHGCSLQVFKKFQKKQTDGSTREVTAPFWYRVFIYGQTVPLVPQS